MDNPRAMAESAEMDKKSRTATWGIVVIVVALVVLTLRRSPDGALVGSTVDTSAFDGRYRLIADESFATWRAQLSAAQKQLDEDPAAGTPPEADATAKIADLRALIQYRESAYTGFSIRKGVIRSGSLPIQEFSLLEAKTTGDELVGVALWHEDVDDPGDAARQPIRLKLTGDRLEFIIGDESDGFEDPVILERLPES